MQCNDLEWFYCNKGEIMDANKAVEKRFEVFRKISQELKRMFTTKWIRRIYLLSM